MLKKYTRTTRKTNDRICSSTQWSGKEYILKLDPNNQTNKGKIHAIHQGQAHVNRAKNVQNIEKIQAEGFILLISFILSISKLILKATRNEFNIIDTIYGILTEFL